MHWTFTRHASSRLQQRAIPVEVLDLLDLYGASKRCGRAEKLYFDRRARRRLAETSEDPHHMRRIERWLNVYAVIGDNGRVVTVGRRKKRVKSF